MVTVAASPSGTAATATDTPTRNASSSEDPRASIAPESAIVTSTPSTTMTRVSPATLRCNGVGGGFALCVSPAIRPSSVDCPVAVSTARPRPRVIAVPAYTIEDRSASGVAVETGSIDLSTGTDSPVSVDSSTARPAAATRRPSAGTRSPSRRTTRSPGTSCSTPTPISRSSRTTLARRSSASRRPRTACSALASWTNPRSAFRSTIAKTIAASTRSPISADTSAAATRRATSGSRNCRSAIDAYGGRVGAASLFGPKRARRSRAPVSLSPRARSVPSVRALSSTDRACRSPFTLGSAAWSLLSRRLAKLRRMLPAQVECHR